MRLNKWIFLGVILALIDLSQQSENEAGKKTVVRKKIRRRLDLVPSSSSEEESSKSAEIIPASSTSADILPKSTTFTEARKALFDRLNRPNQKEHDSTMSKLRSRLGMSSTELPKKYYKKKVVVKKLPKPQTNDSMIIIPVPESQRKPYQPVIMQVTKSNESSTSAPETRVVTYKLNKMFVPMGIYGKVVQDSSPAVTGRPAPEIRHKGTASPHQEKKLKRKPKQEQGQGHQRIADTVDLTYNPTNYDHISITTDTLDDVGSSGSSSSGGQDNNRRVGAQDQTRLTVPGPLKESTQHHGFLDTLRQTVSNIPGVFHKGLTSLTSLTSSFSENPFSDDTFTSASDTVSTKVNRPVPVMASIPGGVIQPHNNNNHFNKNKKNPTGLSGYETLEYFRNRPHLFGRRLQGLDELTTSWKDYLFSRKSVPSSPRNYNMRQDEGIPLPPPFERRKSLDAQWKSITRKYTKTEIDEAKDRLFETFADPPSSAEIKALRTGAFEDLMQMFKLYLSPTGTSTAEDTATAADDSNAVSNNQWMPISKKQPSISSPNKNGLSHHISTLSKNTHYSKHYPAAPEGYELIPSDVYFSQKNPNLEEIAAVVKPAGVSEELVKSVLPKEVANLDFYDYPRPQQTLTSLTDLTHGGASLLQRNRDKAQQYKAKEETFMLPQKYYDVKYTSSEYPATTRPPKPPVMKIKEETFTPQKYYDISKYTPEIPTTRPPPPIFKESNRRVSVDESRIKFFAPIPISPATMLTSSSSGAGRYSNPVPRYVVELAKKLQKDRDVQGIVRVSTKRANGPPIEYLYPVRG